MVLIGIDVYAKWDEQTSEEHEAQLTGFSIEAGDRGYLRESIGGVHAVTWLMPEAFADEEDGSLEHARNWYGNGGEFAMADSIVSALTSGKLMEAVGLPADGVVGLGGGAIDVIDQASGGFPPDEFCVEAERIEYEESWHDETYTVTGWAIPHEVLRRRLPLAHALADRRYDGDPEGQECSKKSLTDFVDLIGELEKAGRRPSIYVSY